MLQGKPVIGMRYSGNLEFMKEDNNNLVSCAMAANRRQRLCSRFDEIGALG